jgi:RND family efflux transporter MFP subunit
MKKYITGLFIIAALVVGCHSEHNHSTTAHQHEESEEHHHDGHDHESGEHANEISFTRQQAAAVGLVVQTIESGTFRQVIKTSGQIQSAQGDEVTIVATSAGTVSFVNASITDGTAVRAGEAIVNISAKNIQDGDPSVKAKIEYETAQKEYQRAEELIKDKIISAKDFEQIRMRYETAKNAYDAYAAHITSNGVRVVSPISGYIKNRFVSQGEYVSVGQPVATISQNRRLQLRAEVPEAYFKEIKSVNSANFKMPYDDTVYKLSELNGRLLSFGKTSNRSSFYIPVTFEFDNVGDIIPGSFAEIYLLSLPQENVITVPVSAVTEEQSLYFVYRQLDEEGYEKQEITLGMSDGENVQALSGLKSGDKIVTKGVYQVKLAANSSIIPEGHSHSH